VVPSQEPEVTEQFKAASAELAKIKIEKKDINIIISFFIKGLTNYLKSFMMKVVLSKFGWKE